MNTTTLISTNELTTGQAAVVGGILGTAITLSIIVAVLLIIAGWKIFVKAGEKGWKSLIPIYNYYVLYKIVGMQNYFWGMLVLSLVCEVIFLFNDFDPNMTEAELQAYDFGAHFWVVLAIIVLCITGIVVDIMHTIRMAKAFHKGTGFTVLMVIFPNICWLILGLGKDKFDKKALKA